MKQLFAARNKLRECSLEQFAQYIENNQQNLTSIDYTNLLQQAFNLYKHDLISYLKLFHTYWPDIVFVELDDGKKKLTVLEQIVRYGRQWELQQLIKIHPKLSSQFTLKTLNWAISNIHNQKYHQNILNLVKIILNHQPNIIKDPIEDKNINPLLQSISKQLYQVALLLLSYQCYLLVPKNYTSNQLHYLLGNKAPKKYHGQIMSLAQELINKKVDPYQFNQNGKTAFDLAHPDLKDQLLKITKKKNKNIVQNKNYSNTLHSNKPIGRSYDDLNNKYQNQSYKQNTNLDKNQDYKQNKKNKYDKGSRQDNKFKFKDKSSSSNSLEESGSKTAYKGKVKSEFGGKQMIKENNQLLRINIQNKNLSFHQNNNLGFKDSQGMGGGDSQLIRITNYEQLQNQATIIFQRQTLKKQQQFEKQKAQYEKQKRQKKLKRTRVIQSQQLKYYLREEILELTDDIKKHNEAQRPAYTRIFEEIKTRLQQKIPLIKVDIFGSFATNLHLDLSDIDIVIIGKEGLRETGEKGREFDFRSHQRKVHQIFQAVCSQLMSMSQFIEQVTYLDKASIPIIKATCKKEYDFKNIDISFQDEQHKGVDSVSLIKQYLQVYPELNNLMLVLKKFIYETKLFSPYSGGLSSYGLFLMAVALIQYEEISTQNPLHSNENKETSNFQKRPFNTEKQGCQQKTKDIHLRTAELLINFLKFYGFKIDFVTQKIILNKPYSQKLFKTIVYNPQWQNEFPPQPKLIIMDPLYEENNVGKATRRIKQIKMAFELAFIAIHTNKRCQSKKSCDSYKRIKAVHMEQVRFKENKRPCCILERMFRCTDNFNLQQF